MLSKGPLSVILMAMACLFATTAGGNTITWKKGTSGNWSDSSNWNPRQVPSGEDTAVITASGNYTVTLDTSTFVSSLVLGSSDTTTQTFLINGQSLGIGASTVNSNGVINLNSGTITFASSVGSIINGTLTCSGGTLDGVLTIASNAVVNLVGVGSSDSILLGGLSLTNYGTVLWSNTDLICSSTQGVQVYNYGLWDAQSDNTFYFSSGNNPVPSTFNNYGIFRKDGGSSETYVWHYPTFNNFGTLDVETAQIEITYGSGGGVFNTASNAIVLLDSFSLTGDATFTGPGQVQEGDLIGYDGVIHGSLNLDNCSLSGTLTIASNAVVNLVGVGSGQSIYLGGLSLTNYGTVLWSNTDLEGYTLGAQIYNYGLWNALIGNTFYGGVGSTFNNYSTFRNYGDSLAVLPFGEPTIDTVFDGGTTFNNSGLVDVQGGWLEFEGGSSLAGGKLNFGIEGPINYGQLSYWGNEPLAGSLSVNFNNYSPIAGDSYFVINYYTLAGSFTPLNLPSLPPPLSWQPNYQAGEWDFVSLNVVSSTPQLSEAMKLSGNSASFSWNGLLGQTYQVQCTTNLAPANWVNLGASIAGSNSLITVPDSLTNSPQKFYRLELQ